jgi:hypothetical protein
VVFWWVHTLYLSADKCYQCLTLSVVSDDQGPDFDDMSSFFPCIICGSLKYINPGYELLVTKM